MSAPPVIVAVVWLAIWLITTEPARPMLLASFETPPAAAAAMIREASAAITCTSPASRMLPPLIDAAVLSAMSA